MPIYYNGDQIGPTYDEILSAVRPLVGEKFYEINEEDKLEFDRRYPHIKGNYPELKISARILEDYKLPGLGGITLKFEVLFPNPSYHFLDQEYKLEGEVILSRNNLPYIQIRAYNINNSSNLHKDFWTNLDQNEELKRKLFDEFAQLSECPKDPMVFQEAWKPFSRNSTLKDAWQEFVDQKQPYINFDLPKDIPSTGIINQYSPNFFLCTYRSVICDQIDCFDPDLIDERYHFYCEEDLRPTTNVSRSHITHLPLPLALTIETILRRNYTAYHNRHRNESLKVWRDLIGSPYGTWAMAMLDTDFKDYKYIYKKPTLIFDSSEFEFSYQIDDCALRVESITNQFYKAYIQENYHILISYTDGQVLSMEKKRSVEGETIYDLLPPLMICKAADDSSRAYLCCVSSRLRRGITEDHRFTQWLLKNAKELHTHYPRQLEQIVRVLREGEGSEIIETSELIRELFRKWGVKKIDVESMPVLSEKDFWDAENF